MRLGAQPFLWKWVLFAWEWKMISISKAEHLPSFWNRGRGNSEMAYSTFAFAVVRKQPTFHHATNGFPAKRRLRFHTDDASLLISGKCFWLVEENFISMEFLRSFLRRHFVGKPSHVQYCRTVTVIGQPSGNRWWRREMSFVLLGNLRLGKDQGELRLNWIVCYLILML